MFEALTMYLPLLKNDDYGRWVIDNEHDGITEPKQVPFVNYSRIVCKLMVAICTFVEDHRNLNLYEYHEIISNAGIKDPWKADVSNLDARTVAALIVAAWRAERFCDGAFLGCLKDGLMEKWLTRLLDLDMLEIARSTASNEAIVILGFNHVNEKYGYFSNEYPAEFKYAGQRYANCAQYMAYQKATMFNQYELAFQILDTPDPSECQKLVSQNCTVDRPEIWEKTCYRIAFRGVKAKFSQNPHLLKILVNTGNAILAKCSYHDKKWGIGISIDNLDWLNIAKWRGKNLLGRILMEVREQLSQEVALAKSYNLTYKDARKLPDIPEWKMTAGVLKRIPQFYYAIHAYSDTFVPSIPKEAFYHSHILSGWDEAMCRNMGGGLPLAGFYEMKQDVYDTVKRNKMFSKE